MTGDATPRGYQRAYLKRTAHLLSDLRSLNSYASARCGIGPSWFAQGWRGSGSQDEIDLLATLPVCRRCARLIEQDRAT